MSYEPNAHACAKLNNEKITRMLGTGNFGEAYLSDKNTVYKITKDCCEALTAAKIKDNPNELFAQIHNVKRLTPDTYLITQEYVNHDTNADALFWDISNEADRAGLSIEEIITESFDEVIHEIHNDNVRSSLNSIKKASDYLKSLGIEGMGVDCQSDNFAITDNGLKFFDTRDEALTQTAAKEKLAREHPEVFAKNKSQELDFSI